ncbi:acyl-CoA thioesterase domain-containing protein [Mycolicibacterium thermoresistibile]
MTDTVDVDHLQRSIQDTLTELLRALELEPVAADRFRAGSESDRFGRIFGGQVVGQALLAAARTVPDHPPHSLHAYFVQTGDGTRPLDIAVQRIRDGRSMATRQVTVTQDDRTLLTALVSFHDNPDEPRWAAPAPVLPGPEQLPVLQHWAATAPPALRPQVRHWIDVPPPLDIRIGEATYFLGGRPAEGPRSHWMRLPRDVGDDPLLHRVLVAYASDYLLLDAALRAHPDLSGHDGFQAVSLDHSVWLHRPVRFDRWHVYTQNTTVVSGHRALVRGTIHDAAGALVASTSQEVLIRPAER